MCFYLFIYLKGDNLLWCTELWMLPFQSEDENEVYNCITVVQFLVSNVQKSES